eukprot:TRINITY_DN15629_c0_g1_i2.p1 TRINITY_DN15629_c0_g1~~TRINITY_DN15629_c0_g1_i2.p1  ORF type:complete len:226 (+),score=56.91 TRINITY_DN15629_c0_g1_i2:602-1279(+)
MQLNLGKTGFKAALMLNGHGVCKYVKHAWDGAGVRVAADGGWKKVAAEGMKDPTHVVGDMDSGGCGASGVVVRVPRQDNTDFMKCLDFLEKEGITGDLPVGFALGGRLDHLMTNLRSLLHTPTIRPILFDSTNMATLLYPGTTTITYTPLYTTKGIGIIPLTPSPMVTTTGLEWDLNKQTLGYLPHEAWTSCNHCKNPGSDITVTTTGPVLFTCEIDPEYSGSGA